MLIEEARAKVNLTLRVVGRRVDGYHDARAGRDNEQASHRWSGNAAR